MVAPSETIHLRTSSKSTNRATKSGTNEKGLDDITETARNWRKIVGPLPGERRDVERAEGMAQGGGVAN